MCICNETYLYCKSLTELPYQSYLVLHERKYFFANYSLEVFFLHNYTSEVLTINPLKSFLIIRN